MKGLRECVKKTVDISICFMDFDQGTLCTGPEAGDGDSYKAQLLLLRRQGNE